jgi:hypothetical protein
LNFFFFVDFGLVLTDWFKSPIADGERLLLLLSVPLLSKLLVLLGKGTDTERKDIFNVDEWFCSYKNLSSI